MARMHLSEVLRELEELGSERGRVINARHGAGERQLGVKLGDLRVLAKRIGPNASLARELWDTRIDDAMLLSTLLFKPKDLGSVDLDRMVRTSSYSQIAEWLMSNLIKPHPERESLRTRWMVDDHPMATRAGWHLTSDRVAKDPDGLDLGALLDRIDQEMANAPDPSKWTMNMCLAMIGIHHPDLRARSLEIGERIGAYRDYPTPKGCTSPFAPIWIEAMVKRQA